MLVATTVTFIVLVLPLAICKCIVYYDLSNNDSHIGIVISFIYDYIPISLKYHSQITQSARTVLSKLRCCLTDVFHTKWLHHLSLTGLLSMNVLILTFLALPTTTLLLLCNVINKPTNQC